MRVKHDSEITNDLYAKATYEYDQQKEIEQLMNEKQVPVETFNAYSRMRDMHRSRHQAFLRCARIIDRS